MLVIASIDATPSTEERESKREAVIVPQGEARPQILYSEAGDIHIFQRTMSDREPLAPALICTSDEDASRLGVDEPEERHRERALARAGAPADT